MTARALTRPGERDRLIGEIDGTFCFLICLIAGIGELIDRSEDADPRFR